MFHLLSACHRLLAFLLPAAFLAFLFLSTLPGPTVNPLTADLDDVVAAFAFQPHNKDLLRRNLGYVALMKADGSAQLIRTSHMDGQQLAWTQTGLFFADKDRNYFISANATENTVRPIPKDSSQAQMLALDDGNALGIYRPAAESDPSNQLQIQRVTPQPSRLTAVAIPNTTDVAALAQCTTGIKALTTDGTSSSSFSTTMTMHSLGTDNRLTPTDSWSQPPNDFTVNWSTDGVPCLKDTMVIPGSITTNKTKTSYTGTPALLTWNARTRERTILPVKDESGRALAYDYATQQPISLELNRQAVTADGTSIIALDSEQGTLYKLNPRTGRILQSVRTPLLSQPPQPSQSSQTHDIFRLQATPTALVVLQPSLTVAGTAATIAPTLLVYGKDSLQLQYTMTPKGNLARLLANRGSFFLTSFAVNPSLATTNEN